MPVDYKKYPKNWKTEIRPAIALNNLGVKYDNYFASEICSYAIKVAQSNYPNTVQLGNVCHIKGSDLPKIMRKSKIKIF
jgi:hypothetical protein